MKTAGLLNQYHQIKQQHPNHVLFFRCGDFYEMFNDDAKLCAEQLRITLTSRGTDDQGRPIPLAGVPYHSVDGYIADMIRAGHNVAIVEQVDDNGRYKKEAMHLETRLNAIPLD